MADATVFAMEDRGLLCRYRIVAAGRDAAGRDVGDGLVQKTAPLDPKRNIAPKPDHANRLEM